MIYTHYFFLYIGMVFGVFLVLLCYTLADYIIQTEAFPVHIPLE